MPEYDLLVIGSGVAGRTAVEEARKLGMSVALAEHRELGGTCALRGCEPKKVLVAGVEPVERMRAQRGQGATGDARLDWGELVRFERGFVTPVPGSFERQFASLGVDVLHGTARFTSPDTLRVGDVEVTPRLVLVATGAHPRPLGIPGEALIADSEAFLRAEALPPRVVFVGGGYITFEFAHMVAAAGCHVTVLHRGPRVLEGFDPALAGVLADTYRERGIDVRTGVDVAVVRGQEGALVVELGDGTSVDAGLVVHGAGRVPDLDALDLGAGGVEAGPRGITVDATMRSATNERVFAAGDSAAGWPPLTPVGIAQARVAVRNMRDPGSAVFEPAVVPSVVFSDPPLASIGLTEDAAAKAGIDVVVKRTDSSAWLSARRVGLTAAGAVTLTERDTGRIVGAHLLGHGADEAINVVAAAIAGGLTASDIRNGLWAYPTAGSELGYLF